MQQSPRPGQPSPGVWLTGAAAIEVSEHQSISFGNMRLRSNAALQKNTPSPVRIGYVSPAAAPRFPTSDMTPTVRHIATMTGRPTRFPFPSGGATA